MISIVFSLNIQGVSSDSVTISSFSGEEQLTRPYRFDFDAVSNNPNLAINTIIGSKATFTITRDGDQRNIHGIISEASAIGTAVGDMYAYKFTLTPRIHLLSLSKSNRTFATQKLMSVLDVIQAVISDPNGANLTQDDWDLSIIAGDSYTSRDFWVQYDETDFNFVHRLLEHWGIYYYFKQMDSHEKIVFADTSIFSSQQDIDDNILFSQNNLYTAYEKGLAQTVRQRMQLVSKKIFLKDYNDQKPDAPLTGEANVSYGYTGTYSEYAPNILHDDEAAFLAQVRSEEIGCNQDIFDIETDSPFLSTGFIFKISDHFRQAFNQQYFPTLIRHSGAQAFSAGAYSTTIEEKDLGYQNSIIAIPAAIPYRSPRRISRPNMTGVMPAVVEVETNHGDRADLDSQGRYKIAINFDTADNPPFQRSCAVRMTQPYAGKSMGMQFPLTDGSEVMVGWVDGDPSRPIILGAIPNTQTTSPVTSTNETQNKILTPSGIAFIMNDGPGQDAQASSGSTSSTNTSSASSVTSVYTSFSVPSDGNSHHYIRLGDVAISDGIESSVIASPAFQAADKDARRKTDLSSENYSGIFSYTPGSYTATIGKDSNTVVSGDYNLVVYNNFNAIVKGESYTNIHLAEDSTGILTAEGKSSAYVSEVFNIPKIEYFNDVKMEFNNLFNIEYQFFGLKYASLLNVLGTFEHRLGAQVSLSGMPGLFNNQKAIPGGVEKLGILSQQGGSKPYGSSYNISTSGYSYKQISGVDADHRIFGANSVTIGYRPVTGTAAMAALTATAKSATTICGLSTIAADAAQAFTFVEALGATFKGEPEIYTAIETLALLGLGTAYLSSLAAILTYHLIVAKSELQSHDFSSGQDLIGSTLSMGKDGLALLYGAAATKTSISLGETGVNIVAPTGLKISCGGSVLIFNQTGLTISTKSITQTAETITLDAKDVNAKMNLSVGGSISSIGPIKSNEIIKSPLGSFGG